jgi:hypothetical protein
MKTSKAPEAAVRTQSPTGNNGENAGFLFVRQVSDLSLLAMEILAKQREELNPDAPVRTFVP